MPLSKDLLSQFAKVVNSGRREKTESTVFGTVEVEYGGAKYVRIDGSEQLTPISSTANVATGDRVTVIIKDHAAIVTGNISSPAPRSAELEHVTNEVSRLGEIYADVATVTQLNATNARVNNLEATDVRIGGQLDAQRADITDLQTENAEITGRLKAAEGNIDLLSANDILVNQKLSARDAEIEQLKADDVDIRGRLDASEGRIEDLEAKTLDTTDLEAKFANIDFSNIGEAAIVKIFTESGIIGSLVMSNGKVTGTLVGVTIKGDLIEGGTVVADKLVIQGTDGLYYKLNTDGAIVESEQTAYNSLDGRIIIAKSITATKIDVDDLVAFDATIGGFNISKTSLYSGVKSSASNTTSGVYLDKDGQLVAGDAINFLKYYKNAEGQFMLDISATSIRFGAEQRDVEDAIEEVSNATENAQTSANDAQAAAASNEAQLSVARAEIDILADRIAKLIVGENGESLMTQTEDGWSFDISKLVSKLNAASDAIDVVSSEVGSISASISGLESDMENMEQVTAHIRAAQDADGQPVIHLSASNNEFQVMITNTGIKFLDGSDIPAYISNKKLHIDQAQINESLEFPTPEESPVSGTWVWAARANGNFGLVWKELSESTEHSIA